MRLFNRVKLLTPESVELEFTLAGIGSRTLALVIDFHILVLGLVLFWFVWGTFSQQLMTYLDGLGVNYSKLPMWLVAIGLLVSFAFSTGYFAVFEALWQGQTPGKRFAKIRVIRDDGRPVGLPQTTLRALLQPIDIYFFFIGVFLIIVGQREKRLGDWVAGTLVIQDDRPQVKTALTLSAEARELASQLPKLTDLSQLLPDDFAVISEYLHRRQLMESNARRELSLTLARQTRSIVQLETIPSGLTSDQFLEAVYLAYQEQFPAY
jgi:uncharacterized RDD family membrane protein YckC